MEKATASKTGFQVTCPAHDPWAKEMTGNATLQEGRGQMSEMLFLGHLDT
jgi:hypothetical protein